jgi:hypothetical protein
MKYCHFQNFIVEIEAGNKKAPDFEVGGFGIEGCQFPVIMWTSFAGTCINLRRSAP